MKRKPILLFIVVVGFCVGVAIVKLAVPFAEYAAQVWLEHKGFEAVSVELDYPKAGELIVKKLRLQKDGCILDSENVRVANPFYFIWNGPEPSLYAQSISLSCRAKRQDVRLATDCFSRFSDWAKRYPFMDTEIEKCKILLETDENEFCWQGNFSAQRSPVFLCAQAEFEETHSRQALYLGAVLAHEYPDGYLWWKTGNTDPQSAHWGGMAWKDGQLACLLCEHGQQRTLLRTQAQAQALDLFCRLFLTQSPPSIREK